MSSKSTIKLLIAFNDPNLEPEERDEQAQVLLTELQQADEVESVKRILDPNPPEGNKSLGGFLGGMLMTEVNPVEANGRKLTVKAHSREELEMAIKAAQDFISG